MLFCTILHNGEVKKLTPDFSFEAEATADVFLNYIATWYYSNN